jgi:hypothetical protein
MEKERLGIHVLVWGSDEAMIWISGLLRWILSVSVLAVQCQRKQVEQPTFPCLALAPSRFEYDFEDRTSTQKSTIVSAVDKFGAILRVSFVASMLVLILCISVYFN